MASKAAAHSSGKGSGSGSGGGGVDEWLDVLRGGGFLCEAALKKLCGLVVDVLMEEPNVRFVDAPATVCGDIHGKFFDLLKLFETGGQLPTTSYVFLGDLVDRGNHNCETLQYLLCLKAKYPKQLTLIRGNHETRAITQQYGFYDECLKKYGNANAWGYCMEVFDYFCMAAVVGNSVFGVHGGLSPDLPTVDQIQTLDRVREIPRWGPFADLVWADPEEQLDTWALSPRGAGYLYGGKVAAEFCRVNGLDLIARSHQLVNEGYKYHFDNESALTVWSCPNYCYRCGNIAALLTVSDTGERSFVTFDEAQASKDTQGAADIAAHYFL